MAKSKRVGMDVEVQGTDVVDYATGDVIAACKKRDHTLRIVRAMNNIDGLADALREVLNRYEKIALDPQGMLSDVDSGPILRARAALAKVSS